jgi:multidrug efflux pump subunit AcrA (membrane-fusion protein)
VADDVRAARLRRRRVRRRRWVAAGTGLVVVGAGSAVAVAGTTGDGPGKRYATVGRATVTEVVEASGTVTSSAKATPSFPVSGTVRSVAVSVGDAVRKGQALARLDTTSLESAVDSAESTLANAKQRLEADESGQTSSSGSSGGSAGGSTLSAGGYSANDASYTALVTPAAAAPPSGTGSLPSAQQAVLTAQKDVDDAQAALDTAEKALTDAVTENTALRDAQHTACTAGTDATTGPATVACANARADYEAYADDLAAANKTVSDAVTSQDAATARLDTAIAALDKLLAGLSTGSTGGSGGSGSGGSGNTGGKTGGTGGSGTTGRTGGTGNRTGGTGGTGGTGNRAGGTGTTGGTGNQTGGTGSTAPSTGQSTTQTASAAQLAADQADIDAAAAALRSARQDLRAATLRSPLTGTVAAVGLTAGGPSGGTVTVVGAGVPKVTIAVPLAQIDLIKDGQATSVAVDGVSRPLTGTVSAIGLLSSTSGSQTTFPVTVQLAAGTPRLYDGAGADVRITTGTARNVLTVPNSAIATRGRGLHTVTVVRGPTTSTVVVTLGVAGTALTEVRKGLEAGDRVVLADYGQSVPTSTNSTTTNRFGRLFGGTGTLPAFPRGN